VEVTATAWVATVGLIIVLLGLDLAVGALRPHAVGLAEATAWSVFYIAVAVVLGLLLIWTAVQLYRHRDEDPDVDDNALVRATRRVLPTTTEYQDGRLISRVDGRRAFTPLFIVLVAIGSTDLLFALDSIPAVFGVTEEPYLVFAANAFALLGLGALFFDPAARAHAGSLRAHATRPEAETPSAS
jgi:tellurite resistance protein TerC